MMVRPFVGPSDAQWIEADFRERLHHFSQLRVCTMLREGVKWALRTSAEGGLSPGTPGCLPADKAAYLALASVPLVRATSLRASHGNADGTKDR